MQPYQHYFEANRALWNERTRVHRDSAFYDVPAFVAGKNMLNAIELEALGDIKGKKILHLQCHFGIDTLCLARLGARVTGVDLSDAAIAEAQQLAATTGLEARFICCNVYDLEQHLNEEFDIVFASYGVISWLPDLGPWAALIARFLRPGGAFVFVEFHPVVWMFSDDFSGVQYHYLNHDVIDTQTQGTYADPDAPIRQEEYSWNHGLSEVLNPLLRQGLQLEFLEEYTYSPYPCFNGLVQGRDGFWRVKGLEDKIPMVYALRMKNGRTKEGPGR